ncbi:hypothetical protein [Limnobacter sp.]|uniref:hypothetical protein n=1 Tax=Limnobacter sp. TaxID=2003368 RepID=UPI00391943C3
MKLHEIFNAGNIICAHIIDDAYDDFPSHGIPPDMTSQFIQELDDTEFELACNALHLDKPDEQKLIEALVDPERVRNIFSIRDKFRGKADTLFGEYLADKETKIDSLKPLIRVLEANGLQCLTFGVNYAVEKTTEAPQLVFIDLRLIEDGSPVSVDPAVEVFRRLQDHHKECRPFVFLMSTLVDPLRQRREEFRLKAKLFASQFESLEKGLFADEAELTHLLERYARVLPQLNSLQRAIEDIGTAVHKAVSNVQEELKNLDLADYFVLHQNTVSIEQMGLGTYVSALVLEFLLHEVENSSQIWAFASELDKLRLDNLPRSRFAVTPAAGKIYSGTLLHAQGRLDAERDRELGPSHGYFYLGDIFFPAKELNDSVPKTALVIATPTCDLIRPEILKQRTVFLCEGKVQLLSTTSVPAGKDGLPGVIVNHPTNSKKQLLINWNKKKLHTWHQAQLDEFKNEKACHWVLVGRLRPLYALQLQHAVTADLSRVGVQRAPNIIVPQGIEILIKKNGKWTLLDNTDAKDATAAAFSESEDKSKTVFILSDVTVYRIRQKLRKWIESNQSKSSATPNEGSSAKNDEVATTSNNIAGKGAVQQVSGVEGEGGMAPDTGQSGQITAAEVAKNLDKLMRIADFDQRLMYSEWLNSKEIDAPGYSEGCAFPLNGVNGLSEEEWQSFVIVRAGKQSIYKNVTGGQDSKEDQKAVVVLKLQKV